MKRQRDGDDDDKGGERNVVQKTDNDWKVCYTLAATLMIGSGVCEST